MAAASVYPSESGTRRGNWELLGVHTQVTGTPAAAGSTDVEERQRVEDFLFEARERFMTCATASNKQRIEMLADLKFECGLQWDEAIELRRRQQGRPCLTINRIPGFLKHVVNNMRQDRPEIKVDPISSGADEEVAEIRQGIIRYISMKSRAEIAYDTAFEHMCCMGLGYMRVIDGWSDEMSFDKDLFVEWVANPFCVYFDPAASKPDWSDAKYCFIVEDLSPREFRRRFGKDRQAASLSSFQTIGDHKQFWLPGGNIRIAEYFHIEEEDEVLCQLSDGTTAYASDLSTDQLENDVVQQRPAKRPRVIWTLMSGVDVLKQRIWRGKYIPVIPCIGNQTELDGERVIVGMVRYARESQRMYNYMYTSFVEAVALAPKNQFVAEVDQISEFRDSWERANTDPQAVLVYKSKSDSGQLLPPPQRQQAEPPIGAFIEGLKLADQNLKATFSIYEASLGQRGPQESGLAINARKIESDVATYDWVDNFSRSLQYLGMVLDDLLPHYYNSQGRIIQIVREDAKLKPITMNQEFQEAGETKKYDLTQGKFSIRISTGPSAPTRRQEAAKSMLELAKVYPPLMQAAGPQIIRTMDFPGKDQIAAQLEKTMPPELREQDPNNAPPVPPEFQQKLDQALQMVQQLTQAVNDANDKNELERMKQEYETLRTQITAEVQLALGQLKTGSDEAKYMNDRMFEELERIRQSLEPMVAADSKAKSAPAGPPAGAAPSPQPVPAQAG